MALQPSLPAGWSIVVSDGSAIAGAVTVRFGRPEGALDRAADEGRLARDLERSRSSPRHRTRPSGVSHRRGGQGGTLAAVAGAGGSRGGAAPRTPNGPRARGGGRGARIGLARSAGRPPGGGRLRGSGACGIEAGGDRPALPAAAPASRPVGRWEARGGDLRARRDRLAADLAAADRPGARPRRPAPRPKRAPRSTRSGSPARSASWCSWPTPTTASAPRRPPSQT